MAKLEWAAVQAQLLERHPLSTSRIGGAFGALRQIPMHVFQMTENGRPSMALLMTLRSPEACEQARDALLKAGPLPAANLAAPAYLDVIQDALLLKLPFARMSSWQAADAVGLIDQVIAVVAGIPEATAEAAEGARAAIVNQRPTYLTSEQVEELHHVGQEMSEAYAAAPTNYLYALILGVVGAIGGGLAWGAIGAFLNVQAWIVAIGAGWLIAYLMLKGAGKTTLGLQVMVFLLTVSAVLLGEILDLCFRIMQQGGPFAPLTAARVYFENLDQVGFNFLFAVGGGVIGAVGAFKMAAKPDLVPEVEVAEADFDATSDETS